MLLLLCLSIVCKFECRILILRRYKTVYAPSHPHIQPCIYIIHFPTVSMLPHRQQQLRCSVPYSWSTVCRYMCSNRTVSSFSSSWLSFILPDERVDFCWNNRNIKCKSKNIHFISFISRYRKSLCFRHKMQIFIAFRCCHHRLFVTL